MNSLTLSTQDARRPPFFAGLLALSAAALCSSVAAFYFTGDERQWLSNAGWTLGAAVAVLGATHALRHSAPENRSAWRVLLLAAVAWLFGQIAWDIYAVTSYPPSPNVADFLWYAFAVLTAIGVYRFGGGARGRHISWLEVTPLVVAVCAVLTAVMWGEIEMSVLSTSGQIAALAYPVIYVTAVVVLCQALLAGGLTRPDPGVALMSLGLLAEAAAFVLWTPQLLSASYVAGASAYDVLWTAGLVLFGAGAFIACPQAPSADDSLQERRGGVLPSLTFFVVALFQIIYVASGEMDLAVLALSIGVLFIGSSLAARGAVLRRQQEAFRERLRVSEEELREVNERLNRESRRDPLTGLGNRLRLNEDLDALVARNRRDPQPYSAAIFDIDRFKAYNDTFGHQAGDVALASVSEILDHEGRGADTLYRYGGEEILLLMIGSSSESPRAAAERLRAAIESADIHHPNNLPFGVVTISGGVAVAQPGESPDNVIARADKALYEAKARGRNQVVEAAAAAGPTEEFAPEPPRTTANLVN